MKVAVIGSRSLTVDHLEKYLPAGVTEIVSGGARGVDTSAREYAQAHGLLCVEFLPDYEKYGRTAPLRRNLQIIEYADTRPGKSRSSPTPAARITRRALSSTFCRSLACST